MSMCRAIHVDVDICINVMDGVGITGVYIYIEYSIAHYGYKLILTGILHTSLNFIIHTPE